MNTLKNKGLLTFLFLVFLQLSAFAQLQTPWTDKVHSDAALPEYPRPQMVRGNWQNLNGLWDYAVTAKDTDPPSTYEGQILVPYPIESALSGVKKALLPDQQLWYKRVFKAPVLKKEERVLLHFGAVDQQAKVYVNGKVVGEHTGGYDAFSIDITDALVAGENELRVAVLDPTDKGDAPHGKQALNPMWIRYTAVSGIWQTVWLETVPEVSIGELEMTPDIDKGVLRLKVTVRGGSTSLPKGHLSPKRREKTGISVQVFDSGKEIASVPRNDGGNKNGGTSLPEGHLSPERREKSMEIKIPNAKLWSPDDPFLYDLKIKLLYKGKVVDEVKSYFGMRKIAIQKDQNGMERIFLNNKFTYNLGVLDQGYWPDGLYTAPTDEALKFDVQVIKDMGFNTIRKHIKIEPARWYYHCDKIGMMVWQDMPSWRQPRTLPKEVLQNFEQEAAVHLKNLHNYPSIICWVLYNENWGSTEEEQLRLTKWMKETDPSRLVNGHSGPFVDQTWEGSDMTDLHLYPDPCLPPYEEGKAMVCGEFGGTYVAVPGHEWLPGKGWGHSSPPGFSFARRYEQMMEHLLLYKKEGLSGSIFTQPFDVETEENGLMTYDRKVFKIPVGELKKINQKILMD